MSDLLLENYLASQFKFGFELEAFKTDGWINFQSARSWEDDQMPEYSDENDEEESHWDDDQPIEDDDYSDGSYPSYDRDDARKEVEKDIKTAFGFDVSIKSDSSLEPDSDDDYAFEWATPVMDFTPTNLAKCIKGLDYLMSSDYYTNETCGFHVHLSFPNISEQDCIWIISKLAVDEDMLWTLSAGVDGCDFYNEDYAEIEFLTDLGESIKEGNLEGIAPVFTTEKYRALHIHPQGTIEWRGPRDFMNQYTNNKPIYKFFKLLHKFVMWISKTLASKDIYGMSKENYFKIVFGENYKESDLISDFNYKTKREKAEKKLKAMLKNCLAKGDADELIKVFKAVKNTVAVYNVVNQLTNSFLDPKAVQLLHNIVVKLMSEDEKTFKEIFFELVNGTGLLSNLYQILNPRELKLLIDKLLILNDSNCDYKATTIALQGLDDEPVQETIKLMLNDKPDKYYKKYFQKIFSYMKPLALFGEYIQDADYIAEYEIFSSICDTLKKTADAVTKNNENKIILYSHDLPLILIRRVCLNAYKNPVLASVMNGIFGSIKKSFENLNEINNSYINDVIDTCNHFKKIILTGKDE